MMNLRQPQALPVTSSPVDLKTGAGDASQSRPLLGEFDKDLKKNIEQLEQSGQLGIPQVKIDPATLAQALVVEGKAPVETPQAGITGELATVGAAAVASTASKTTDQLLASVPIQPAHSQSGKVKLPAGMVPVHETLTPAQMEVLGKQLEANELAMQGEAELVDVKSPVQAAVQPKAKKAISGEDFLLARSAINTSNTATDAKPSAKPNTPAPVTSSELNVGLAALASSRRNSDSSSSSDKQDSKDQDQSLAKLAQGLGASPMAKVAGFDAALSRVETTGNVVPGSLGTQRLSHDAVATLGSTIQSFSGTGTGGEMRLRLKPDQLGEVFIQVSTLGNKVDLKVRASDDNAKKIIEESLGALKDQLGVHQLSLGSIDVSTAPAPTQSQSQSSTQFDLNQNNQFNLSDSTSQQSGREARQGWGNESRGDSGERLQKTLAQAAMNASGLKRQQSVAPGRLNVMA